mmetsp:Transcript_91878/g.163562  ORF Transcript_91878/g.163562 Transcript_91878/m.163562 type:complete len:84 (-) Transcript_91878:1064-1315(-)
MVVDVLVLDDDSVVESVREVTVTDVAVVVLDELMVEVCDTELEVWVVERLLIVVVVVTEELVVAVLLEEEVLVSDVAVNEVDV